MPGPNDALYPVYEQGGGVAHSAAGAFFNYQGKRVECDPLVWTAPDDRQIMEGLVIPCPECRRPFILAGIKPEMYSEDADKRVTLNVVLRCTGYWQKTDYQGGAQVDNNGRPVVVRCEWVGVIRQGVAHHPQCAAIHQVNCPHPQGGQCGCRMSRTAHDECRCGAITGV